MAHHKTEHHRREQATVKDPVCGMTLSHKTAAETYDYEDQTYYFCADTCRAAFEADPEKYTHRHHPHGATTT
jgi:YHS domain-containing protein